MKRNWKVIAAYSQAYMKQVYQNARTWLVKRNWKAVPTDTQVYMKQVYYNGHAWLVKKDWKAIPISAQTHTKQTYETSRAWLYKCYKEIKMDLTETKISSESVLDGKFVSIARDTVRLPNGNEGIRVVIRHPGAACVLAVTEDDEVVFVRQWRYAIGQPLLEVPAGKLDEDEDPAACALRELAEETPYAAKSVELLHTFYTAPGFCDEKMYLYLAKEVTKTSTLEPDQDEFVETVLLSRDQVKDALYSNLIQDAKTVIALQYWLLNT